VRIVIFKFNHLGDNVVFVPAVQALRRLRPEWHITLLTTPNEAALYQGRWAPQEILVCPKREFDKSYRKPWVLARWILRVRHRRPDACLISFDQGTAAHLVAKLSGARVRIGGNLEHIRVKGSLTEEVPIPPDQRPITWHWRMAAALARALGAPEAWPEAVPPPDLSHLQGGRIPATGRPRVVVHAGSSRPLNQWSQAKFATVARALADECDLTWIEHGTSTGPAPEGTTPVRVTSLPEFIRAIDGADLFLGNNSGPMHLANVLGVPGVAVAGPSAIGWDPYWHRERWRSLRHPSLYCAPCERPSNMLLGCANRESPMACLAYWTPAMVEAACRELLARPREAPA
jgi:ADP-heptose:LPS heptosyltransferase